MAHLPRLTELLGKVPALATAPRSLEHLGLPESDLAAKALAVIEGHGEERCVPSGLDRGFYLDLAERMVRAAIPWQDEKGAIIDPVKQLECGQTSPRFAASGAVLLAFGRIPELREQVERTMSYSCRRLADGEAASPDFWMRELTTAYLCLEDDAKGWQDDLRRVRPEQQYKFVKPDGEDISKLHNWAVYSSCGEILREKLGLAPPRSDEWATRSGEAFFAKYMKPQLHHFTEHGMYRDPGDPITYDITTRLQIATALAFGYDGELRADYDELLRRGGLVQLLFLSPEGYVPYGGRSSQYHFQEAIIAALCELEARRYKLSNPRLAGAFKRQARRSVHATYRWIVGMTPHRSLKNGFPPDAAYGNDPYGVYSVYTLYCASVLGLAALFADDEIAEELTPAEIGGYVFQLQPAFHKIFATIGGTHLEIDTQADPHYDATGIGRFCVDTLPLELGLGMPFTATPDYLLPAGTPEGPALAIGPSRLAAAKPESAALTVLEDSPKRLRFSIDYLLGGDAPETIHQEIELSIGAMAITVSGGELVIPLLVTDGEAAARFVQGDGHVVVAYRQSALLVRFDPVAAGVTATLGAGLVANRNGMYRALNLKTEADRLTAHLRLIYDDQVRPDDVRGN